MNTTTGPYFDDFGEPVLRESVVVVADILGYKQMIKQKSKEGQSESFLRDVHYALRRSIRIVEDPGRERWFAKMMTDNLLVAYPPLNDDIGSSEFIRACLTVGQIQREMIKYWLPMRGGICVGHVHVSDLLVFPNKNILCEMIQAKKKEKGGPPRIILLDSARKFLSDNSKKFSEVEEELVRHLLWEDGDSAQFVNYLWPPSHKIEERAAEIPSHREFIEGSLKKFNRCERIYSKYLWLVNYHNKFCRSVPDFNSTKFLINLKNLET
jgi:hypothetical protein